MADAQIAQTWLNNLFKIQYPDDWLNACIEWIHSEHQAPHLCMYAQIQKLSGTENENVLVSGATQQTQENNNTHNSKQSRMLLLGLTDGQQDIQAIEYRHINSFNDTNNNISCGSKILVHGEVLCRMGVLFLRSENVTALGGEVDSESSGSTYMLAKLQDMLNNSNRNINNNNNNTNDYGDEDDDEDDFMMMIAAESSEIESGRCKRIKLNNNNNNNNSINNNNNNNNNANNVISGHESAIDDDDMEDIIEYIVDLDNDDDAYISTVIGRLEHNSGHFWSLGAKINDGTCHLDVSLGDKLLSKLIGFTAKECHEMREKAKKDLSLREKITQGIKQCQVSLIQLSAIFELEISASTSSTSTSNVAATNSESSATASQRSNLKRYKLNDYRHVTMQDVHALKLLSEKHNLS
ncbi:hypothetical protein HELRODRAFT_162040 [Helobdella robusta]|uniref:RecQ-mediated genome instability protein 1 n=1 Tax=Helobdella robusta TaxID=6412 RepID=T1ES65_HELRO|nr:hypothetical protein HELRODRAFT_162040 [Helobdella robusta]ESN98608.1 hypothetical protein HELRODRAFT_162040 [Helobdella robusta]